MPSKTTNPILKPPRSNKPWTEANQSEVVASTDTMLFLFSSVLSKHHPTELFLRSLQWCHVYIPQSLAPGSLQLDARDYVNTDIPIFFNIISGTVQVPSHQSQRKSSYSSGYSNPVPSLQTFIILMCITSLASNFSFQNLCVCIGGMGGLTCWGLGVHVSWHFLDVTSGFLTDTSKGSFFISLLIKG